MRSDKKRIADCCLVRLRLISERTAYHRAVSHLSNMWIAIIRRAIEQNARRAPGAAFITGLNTTDASTSRPAVLRQGHVPVTRVKNAKEVAAFETANVRKCLIRSCRLTTGNYFVAR